jgi:agmatine deiminase
VLQQGVGGQHGGAELMYEELQVFFRHRLHPPVVRSSAVSASPTRQCRSIIDVISLKTGDPRSHPAARSIRLGRWADSGNSNIGGTIETVIVPRSDGPVERPAATFHSRLIAGAMQRFPSIHRADTAAFVSRCAGCADGEACFGCTIVRCPLFTRASLTPGRLDSLLTIPGFRKSLSMSNSFSYRMPAEWEPHQATWIAWPHNWNDWPGKFAAIPFVYGEIVRHLHQSEHVYILVNDQKAEARARQVLVKVGIGLDRIEFLRIPTNRVWTRDYGPIFVVGEDGRLAIVDFKFNGWAKYSDHERDDRVASRALACVRTRSPSPGKVLQLAARGKHGRIVIEGGAIDINGRGTLMTTEECLLSKVQCRNRDFSKTDYEEVFAAHLGATHTLWLGKGIAGDDTHGHIDDLARFVNHRTVVAVLEDNPTDENYRPLRENWDRLQEMRDQDGKKLEVVSLPMPGPVYWQGQRLPASYANFYIANDRVLVPTFNDANDRKALGILAELFPDRIVVGIHAVDLVWGLGTIHCLTQQQPAVGPVRRGELARKPKQEEDAVKTSRR